jgi:hypothetical protein
LGAIIKSSSQLHTEGIVEDIIKANIPYAGFGFTMAAFILAATRWVNSTIVDDVKLRVSLWILGDAPTMEKTVPMADIFRRLFGGPISTKRLIAVTCVSFGIASAAYLWFNLFYFSGTDEHFVWAPPDMNLATWRDFLLLTMLHLWPIQYLSSWKTGWLLRRIVSRLRWLNVCAYAVFEIVLTFVIDTAWQNLIRIPGALPPSAVIHEPLTSYEEFMRHTFWVIDFQYPILVATYILPLVWIVLVVVLKCGTIIFRQASKAAKSLGRWVSPKRIEEEPISLVGEFTAALVLVIVLGAGCIRLATS